jgi:hypothetical protein
VGEERSHDAVADRVRSSGIDIWVNGYR